MKALSREELESYGLRITKCDSEVTGYLIERFGNNKKSHKKTWKKINPIINIRQHPYGKPKSYYLVGFSNDCKNHTYPMARVIYAWFKGYVPADKDVDHIDNNPTNNNIENLQLLSRSENLAKREGNVNQYGLRKRNK